MSEIEDLIPYIQKPGLFFADSRRVVPEGIFFALKGEKSDGHDFLSEVAKAGAYGAVVSESYPGESFGLRLFPVKDVKETLQAMALIRRESTLFQKVIGITGSVGKTTTKEFLATLLEERYRVGKTKGTENSQVTLPLTLLNSPLDAEILVLEMGMSLKGEMSKLTRIAQPDVVIVTKIGHSHAGNFAHIDEIALEKSKILESPRAQTLFISEQAHTFSIFQKADLKKVIYSLGDETPPLSLQFDATHLIENLKGAIALARHFDLSWEEIQSGCLKIAPVEKRFEKAFKKGVLFLNDSYNASEISTIAALDNLPKLSPSAQLIAVLGEMRELGPFSKEAHANVGKAAAEKVSRLLAYGDEMRWCVESFGPGAERFEDKADLLKRLREVVKEGDVVLIKGSNSLKMWTILEEF